MINAQLRLLSMVAAFFLLAALAHADERPNLVPGSSLQFIDPANSGIANVRRLPDPASSLVLKVRIAEQPSLQATGSAQLYGDTWWIEVNLAGQSGWVNGRLLAHGGTGAPLQSFVNTEDQPEIKNRGMVLAAYRQSPANSFDQCARACARDPRCRALEFEKAASACRHFDQPGALTTRDATSVAAKPIGSRGAISDAGLTYERRTGEEFEGNGYQEVLAGTFVDCVGACAGDARCRAVEYQPRFQVCSKFDAVVRTIVKASHEVGIVTGRPQIGRTAPSPTPPSPTVSAPIPNTVPPGRVPVGAAGAGGKVAFQAAATLFQSILADAARVDLKSSGDLDPRGRLSFYWLAETDTSAERPRTYGEKFLEGDSTQLSVRLAPSSPQRVDLLFRSGGTFLEVIGSTHHASPRAAADFLEKIKIDLARLVQLTGAPILPSK